MSAHEGFMSVESRGMSDRGGFMSAEGVRMSDKDKFMSEEGKGTPCYKHIKTAPAISGSRF